MILSIIAAIGKNNELGRDNQLLWNLPADMKHFREKTSDHPVVMGSKTFESIGRPLPNRRNIVIARDTEYKKDGVEIVHSIEKVMDLFKNAESEVFVIGGGQIYKAMLPFAQKLYITHVDASLPADTFFPEINPAEWQETDNETHGSDEKNAYAYTFTTYERKK